MFCLERLKKKRILKTYFPDYMTNGAIFSKMESAPWKGVASLLEMDIAYIGYWSGFKTASELVKDFSINDIVDSAKLASVLWTLYGQNWVRLWDSYMSSYNPIDNYDITDTSTRDLTNNRVIDRTIDNAGSVDRTVTGSVDTTDTSTTNVTTSGTEKETTSGTGKETDVRTEGVKTSGESKTVDNDHTETVTNSTTDTTENETSTTTYGKVTTDNGESDTYVYAFNSSVKVPTNAVSDNNTNSQSGSDTTKRDLTGKVTNSGGSSSTGNSTTDVTSSGTNDTTINDTKDTTTSGTNDITTSGKNDTTFGATGKVTKSDTIGEKSTDLTTDDTTDNQTEKETITRTRKGNIGKSYQELLLEEFELWKWNFFEQVFNDCDKVLTLSIYSDCNQFS